MLHEEGQDSLLGYQQDAAGRHIALSAAAAFLASVSGTVLQYPPFTADGEPMGRIHYAAYFVMYLSMVLAIFATLLNLLSAIMIQKPQ